MKIFVIPSVYPNDVNPNLGIYIHNQCIGLIELGHEIIVLDASGYKYTNWCHSSIRGINSFKIDGVKVYSTHYKDLLNTRFPYYSIYNYLKGLWRLYKIALKENGEPDLIHAHFSHIAGYGAYCISSKTGIPYIVTEHHSLFLYRHVNSIITKNLDLVINKSKAFICVSEQLRNAIYRYARNGHDIKVIPNMISKKYQHKENIVNEKFIFFSAGNLIKSKRFDYLIDAFILAIDTDDAVLLEIAGSGSEMKSLLKKVEFHGRTHQIRFLGTLSQKEMLEQYRKCNCFVSASLYETFGIVYREALAIGRPVIATKNEGIEEGWSEVFGKLVDPHKIQDFSISIKTIMTDIKMYDSHMISRKCLDMYSEIIVLTMVENIYKEIINDDKIKRRV